MKWIVHLTVVLLNVLWVAFFLTDPLAVFVQRRSSNSSDEEMKVGEFCLQPPSDKMWTSTPGPADVPTDKTRMTSDANRDRTNTPNESQSVSRTATEPDYLNSSQQSDIRAPTAASEPPSTSSAIRDLNEATTAPPTVQTSTSSVVISVISNSTSEAAPVPATDCSTVPVTQRNIRNGQYHRSCCVEVSRMRIPLSEITRYYRTMPRHPCVQAVVLITKNGKQICADPNDKWTQRTVQFIDLTPKIQEASQSDRCASTVRDLTEVTTATIPLHILTSSEVTSELEVISSSTSEAAPVTATESSKTPVTQRKIQNQWDIRRCPCIVFAKSVPVSGIKEYRYHEATPWCSQNTLILITKSGQEICVDPDDRRFQMIMKYIDLRSKTEEASQSDRRASTVRDLTEVTTATIPL
ncbi:uncharacterized protein LOC118471729 [Amphiprion ocellaris]|uniref:uncharacterized protein LOC118471729 n=1 Tax=Amphiprion ocellaris TaxID=80972 RepID=UPI00241160AC|nr:uncharacterized protein LOC118471729 [Amphiprion ocellaris]